MNSRIVIVGAGASGIAAGTKLLELGFNNVVLLEAEERIGGRIKTIPFAANVVDLGAQWCHGEKGNVVYEIAHRQNLLESTGDQYHHCVCIKSNKEILPTELSERLFTIFLELVEDNEQLKDYKGSLGSYVKEKFYAALEKPENADVNKTTADQFFELFQKSQSSIDGADSLFDISAPGLVHYWECEGDPLLNWKDKGYVTFLRLLMNATSNEDDFGVLNKRIILNKEVQAINWDSDLSVKCTDGEVIEADHVICTVSLGVLKERYLDLFQPALPEEKVRAIEGLSIGTVDKIFIEFAEPFWPQDWPGFCTLWEKSDLENVKNTKYNWIEDVFGFFTVRHQPNVLVGWISGARARQMEQVPDEEIREGVLHLLKLFLTWNIPDPVSLKRSTWYNNKNFRGSYSFRSVKSDELNTTAADLAQPLYKSGVPKLLFAGEATHDHYYSTVHGAVEAGWREANRLGDIYKRELSHL